MQDGMVDLLDALALLLVYGVLVVMLAVALVRIRQMEEKLRRLQNRIEDMEFSMKRCYEEKMALMRELIEAKARG
ncbi:MAG: hypothetical protein U0768_09515 [Anaerolineae bacterium]